MHLPYLAQVNGQYMLQMSQKRLTLKVEPASLMCNAYDL